MTSRINSSPMLPSSILTILMSLIGWNWLRDFDVHVWQCISMQTETDYNPASKMHSLCKHYCRHILVKCIIYCNDITVLPYSGFNSCVPLTAVFSGPLSAAEAIDSLASHDYVDTAVQIGVGHNHKMDQHTQANSDWWNHYWTTEPTHKRRRRHICY